MPSTIVIVLISTNNYSTVTVYEYFDMICYLFADDVGFPNTIITGVTNRESTASKTSSLLEGLQGLFEIYSNSLSTPKQQQNAKILDTLEEKEKLNTGTKLVHHHVRSTNTED